MFKYTSNVKNISFIKFELFYSFSYERVVSNLKMYQQKAELCLYNINGISIGSFVGVKQIYDLQAL